MATTRSRPRGRESARPSSGGVAAEHATKIYGVAIGGAVVIIAFLALTGIGHVIDAATQHFMLFYAGVFTLIALCASVGLGLVSTDRMILGPGQRVFAQSAHRAVSFGALAFLVIHIVTEILAQRSHVLDAFVPFLSPFRTFYIGLGTIASDLIVLLVITGILRKRFTVNGNAWKWRAIHYSAYVAFVFGVWHGLLGGRPGKPYVDWSYGFVVAFVALGLAVRILANSLRPKENLSAPPVSESASSGSAPMRAASMFAQLGVVRAASSTLSAVSAPAAAQPMLAAPVGAWTAEPATGPTAALAALPAGPADGRQPLYEPGYEGPPRYMGAPQAETGPLPQATTGGMPRANTGSFPRHPSLPPATGSFPPAGSGSVAGRGTGPMRRAATGPMPRAATGPMPRAGTGPMPQPGTGPIPRTGTGPRPAYGADTTYGGDPGYGPGPGYGGEPGYGSDPAYGDPMYGGASAANGTTAPRPGTGPQPRPGTGPRPRPATGPRPAPGTGPMPRAGTGPMQRPATGPMPRPGTGPIPQAGTGPMPRSGTGPRPAAVPPGGLAGRPGGDRRGPGRPPAPGRADQDWGGPAQTAEWNYGQPPWDGGAPEPDPAFRYREPGPGMPGYRSSRDPYRGGDNLR